MRTLHGNQTAWHSDCMAIKLHGNQTAWQSTGAKIQIIPRQGMLITEAHAESHHGVNAM